MKEHNIISGILIFDLISFFSYLLNPLFVFYYGDLDFLFGAIVGTIFALRYENRYSVKKDLYKIGIITGSFGGFASGLSATIFFYMVNYLPTQGANIAGFFTILIKQIAIAIVIGFLIGILIAYYYSRKKK